MDPAGWPEPITVAPGGAGLCGPIETAESYHPQS